jgi:hypothetical protein
MRLIVPITPALALGIGPLAQAQDNLINIKPGTAYVCPGGGSLSRCPRVLYM